MYFGEEAWHHPITEFRCPGRAALLFLPMVSCRFQIIQSFLTLKATEQAATSGPHRCACSMARWKKPMAENARSIGIESLLGKRHLPNSRIGYPRGPWTRRVTYMSPSKGLSQRP